MQKTTNNKYVPSLSTSHLLTLIPHAQPQAFGGSGATLNGRASGQTLPSSSSSKGKGKEEPGSNTTWGTGGQTLGARPVQGGTSTSNARGRAVALSTASRAPQSEQSPSPERAYDTDEMESDDDSVIYISSDEN